MSTVIDWRGGWIVGGILLGFFLLAAAVTRMDDAGLPEAPVEAGPYMYLQLDGPVLLQWNTRTGDARLCMIQQGEVRCR